MEVYEVNMEVQEKSVGVLRAGPNSSFRDFSIEMDSFS